MNDSIKAKMSLKEFQEQIKETDKVVLVDFYLDGCEPCKELAPTLKELSEEYKDLLYVVKLNCSNENEYEELEDYYGVRAYPTMLIFKNGKKKNRIIGNKSKEHILKVLQQY